jgi:hypothetical protein
MSRSVPDRFERPPVASASACMDHRERRGRRRESDVGGVVGRCCAEERRDERAVIASRRREQSVVRGSRSLDDVEAVRLVRAAQAGDAERIPSRRRRRLTDVGRMDVGKAWDSSPTYRAADGRAVHARTLRLGPTTAMGEG